MTKYPNLAGFIGHEGNNVLMEPSQPYDDDDLLVQARPDLFTDTPPEGVEPPPQPKRKPGRPLGSKNQPKPPPTK